MDFPSTVAPFILRGITLAGIDSVMAPITVRERAWQRLATDLDRAALERMTREISLAQAIPAAAEILAGQVRGRLVVDVNR
jgi:acrylyl-CoA reductase (NADPH)